MKNNLITLISLFILTSISSCDIASLLVKREAQKNALEKQAEEKRRPSTKAQQAAEKFYDRGIEQYNNMEYDEALASVYEAVRLDDTNMEYLFLKSIVLTELEQYESALMDLHYIQNNIGEDINIYYQLGVVFYRKGDIQTSLEYLKTCHSMDTTNFSLQQEIAVIYYEENKPDSARLFLKKAIDLHPELMQTDTLARILFPGPFF